jgi:hypothetical protein
LCDIEPQLRRSDTPVSTTLRQSISYDKHQRMLQMLCPAACNNSATAHGALYMHAAA